jgi:hypothetical protein
MERSNLTEDQIRSFLYERHELSDSTELLGYQVVSMITPYVLEVQRLYNIIADMKNEDHPTLRQLDLGQIK